LQCLTKSFTQTNISRHCTMFDFYGASCVFHKSQVSYLQATWWILQKSSCCAVSWTDTHRIDTNTMAQQLCQITNVKVMAVIGMVAAQNIMKGTVILEDDPLVIIDTNIAPLQCNLQWIQVPPPFDFYTYERNDASRRTQSALRSPAWRNNRTTFRALSSG
jgi:hypothetical protein